MRGIGLKFAALHFQHEFGEDFVGATGNAEPRALARDQAVHEFDLGAAALHHVLTHRGTLLTRKFRRVLETLFLDRARRLVVALARARDGLGRQMQYLLERVALRLADTDRLAAEPRGEAA